jgi:signal transduction histidine kinase
MKQMLVFGLYIGLMLFVVLHNLFLFLSLRHLSYLYYAIFSFLMLILVALNNGFICYFLPNLDLVKWYIILSIFVPIVGLTYAISFLKVRQYAPRLLPFGWAIGMALFGLLLLSSQFSHNRLQIFVQLTLLGLYVFLVTTAILVGRKGNRVGYFFAITYFIFFAFFGINSVYERTGMLQQFFYINYLSLGILIEVLLQSFLLAKRFEWEKADMEKEREEAQAQLLEKTCENEQFVREQNVVLENKVLERTAELKKSLANLRETKNQLVQQEKLASLGELTAGIAHEIQNPLNFVNNFAEVSADLLAEMNEELDKGDTAEAKAIAADLVQNLQKINHHGQRASSIVKGMLEHSRASTGQKEPTDLNQMADEYLRLAYHGLRAKESRFNCQLEANLDPNLPKVAVIPQDIGRVLLNLINNALHAVQEKAKMAIEGYEPKVSVSSALVDGQVELQVQDNGMGIPEVIREKIFQPFFTTKPTGQGTGLGLSLAYDIVVKGHGGMLEVDTKEGRRTIFSVKLPL